MDALVKEETSLQEEPGHTHQSAQRKTSHIDDIKFNCTCRLMNIISLPHYVYMHAISITLQFVLLMLSTLPTTILLDLRSTQAEVCLFHVHGLFPLRRAASIKYDRESDDG